MSNIPTPSQQTPPPLLRGGCLPKAGLDPALRLGKSATPPDGSYAPYPPTVGTSFPFELNKLGICVFFNAIISVPRALGCRQFPAPMLASVSSRLKGRRFGQPHFPATAGGLPCTPSIRSSAA